MTIQEAKIGMKVRFGRGNGQWTLGEIVKINPTNAKVKTLESRGNGRGSEAGAVWGVPYSMMLPADGTTFLDEYLNTKPIDPAIMQAVVEGAQRKLADAPVSTLSHGDSCIMEAIVDCYNQLSPEWLTCDGELPMHEVRRRRDSLNSRLGHLFKAFGRPVSEIAAYDWDDARRKEKV